MNQNAKKWVEALRSGKFAQAKRRLRTGDTFCCLGVACEISGLGRWVEGPQDGLLTYATQGKVGYDCELPPRVQAWLGMKNNEGVVNMCFKGLPEHGSLTSMNDAGYSFERIADIIENNASQLFV